MPVLYLTAAEAAKKSADTDADSSRSFRYDFTGLPYHACDRCGGWTLLLGDKDARGCMLCGAHDLQEARQRLASGLEDALRKERMRLYPHNDFAEEQRQLAAHAWSMAQEKVRWMRDKGVQQFTHGDLSATFLPRPVMMPMTDGAGISPRPPEQPEHGDIYDDPILGLGPLPK